MKKALLFIIICIATLPLSAQKFELPEDIKLVEKEDYAMQTATLMSAMDWLLKTPLDVEPENRKDVNTFVLRWITGSPSVKIEIRPEIVNFISTSPDLLIIFLAGWAKYSIENEYSQDKLMGNVKGIETSVSFYEKNRSLLKKDKNIEKYKKMIEKGELEKVISKQLNTNAK